MVPASKDATLTLSTTAQTGFEPAVGSDGKDYWYQFAGGSNGKGHFHGKKSAPHDVFTLELTNGKTSGFRFGDVTFSATGTQLSLDFDACKWNKLVILDVNTQVMNGYYAILVVYQDLVHIMCDPMIKNDP